MGKALRRPVQLEVCSMTFLEHVDSRQDGRSTFKSAHHRASMLTLSRTPVGLEGDVEASVSVNAGEARLAITRVTDMYFSRVDAQSSDTPEEAQAASGKIGNV